MKARPGRAPRVCLAAIVFLITGPLTPTAQDPARPPIDEFVATLQVKYDSVRDFSADFTHTYAGGVLRTTLTEYGTVHVKKPGMMRWDYTTPEEKLFVSDGTTLYSYIPLDRQVFVGQVPPEDRASTPVLFLTGKGRLSRDFTVIYDDAFEAPPGTWMLRLTPRVDDADYEWLTLAVDRVSLSITQLIATDFQGGVSTFTFTSLRDNEGLSDHLFTFEIPRGTEVITADTF